MEAISGDYKLKEDKKTKKYYVPPYLYLGTNTQKFRHPDTDEDEPHCESMSGDYYVKNIIFNIKERLNKSVHKLDANQR